MLLEKLDSEDSFGLISFNNDAYEIIPLTKVKNLDK
jgi:hypothetical protein